MNANVCESFGVLPVSVTIRLIQQQYTTQSVFVGSFVVVIVVVVSYFAYDQSRIKLRKVDFFFSFFSIPMNEFIIFDKSHHSFVHFFMCQGQLMIV